MQESSKTSPSLEARIWVDRYHIYEKEERPGDPNPRQEAPRLLPITRSSVPPTGFCPADTHTPMTAISKGSKPLLVSDPIFVLRAGMGNEKQGPSFSPITLLSSSVSRAYKSCHRLRIKFPSMMGIEDLAWYSIVSESAARLHRIGCRPWIIPDASGFRASLWNGLCICRSGGRPLPG